MEFSTARPRLDSALLPADGRGDDVAEMSCELKRIAAPVHWDVFVRDLGVCQYGGLDGKTDVRILRNLQLDHLQSKRYKVNGQWVNSKLTWAELEHRDNLVVCCPFCNICKVCYEPLLDIEPSDDPEVRRLRMIEVSRAYVLQRTFGKGKQDSDYYAHLFELLTNGSHPVIPDHSK